MLSSLALIESVAGLTEPRSVAANVLMATIPWW